MGKEEDKKRKDILSLLDTILLMMMLVEKLEEFQIESSYNKMQIKQSVQKLLKIITPIAERDYLVIFRSNEEESQNLIREYENLIAQLRDFTLPEKIMLSRVMLAFSLDRETVEVTTHRILKKAKNEPTQK